MANTGRNFSLTEHQRRFVSGQVASGRHASGSEVIREALRRYEDDVLREQPRLAALNRLAEQGEAAYAHREYTRLTGREELRDFIRQSGARGANRRSENVAFACAMSFSPGPRSVNRTKSSGGAKPISAPLGGNVMWRLA